MTLRASLNSIVPAIQRGIIAYHECDDGSEEIILDFCRKNPGFIAYHYPYQVRPVTQEEASRMGVKTLHEYYNDVLDQIPEGQWLIKIDCDQIYDAAKLFKSFYLALCHDDVAVVYQRLDLHYERHKDQLFMHAHAPVLDPGDHWLIRKYKLSFEHMSHLPEGGAMNHYGGKCLGPSSCELLRIDRTMRSVRPELNTWHFPAVKNQRKFYPEIWREYDADESQIPGIGYRIDPQMLDKERILQICRLFEWDDEK